MSALYSVGSREAGKLLIVGVTDANCASSGRADGGVGLDVMLTYFSLGAEVGGCWTRANTFPLGNN